MAKEAEEEACCGKCNESGDAVNGTGIRAGQRILRTCTSYFVHSRTCPCTGTRKRGLACTDKSHFSGHKCYYQRVKRAHNAHLRLPAPEGSAPSCFALSPKQQCC